MSLRHHINVGLPRPSPRGRNGWSPVLAVVEDGARRVHQVVDWIEGTGTKPLAGSYLSEDGFTPDIALATDIRGLIGPRGIQGLQGIQGEAGPQGDDGPQGPAGPPETHTHTASEVTDFSEAVDDRVASLLVAGNSINVAYNDSTGQLTVGAQIGGQCRFEQDVSDGVTRLRRWNGGKYILINGVPQAIPAAGVVPSGGLTSGVANYAYAYMDAGVMKVEWSTTGHTRDTTTGDEIKSGDPGRSLVGMWWGNNVISWHNRQPVWFGDRLAGSTYPNGGSYITTNTVNFPCWIGTYVYVEAEWRYRTQNTGWDSYGSTIFECSDLYATAGANRIQRFLPYVGINDADVVPQTNAQSFRNHLIEKQTVKLNFSCFDVVELETPTLRVQVWG